MILGPDIAGVSTVHRSRLARLDNESQDQGQIEATSAGDCVAAGAELRIKHCLLVKANTANITVPECISRMFPCHQHLNILHSIPLLHVQPLPVEAFYLIGCSYQNSPQILNWIEIRGIGRLIQNNYTHRRKKVFNNPYSVNSSPILQKN